MAVISKASDHFKIAAHICVVKIIDRVVSGNIVLLREEVPPSTYGVTAVPHNVGPDLFFI